MDQFIEFLNSVGGYITLYAPSVVSVISMIVTLLASFKKLANTSKESLSKLDSVKEEITDQMHNINLITKENSQLKRKLAEKVENEKDEIILLKNELEVVKEQLETTNNVNAELIKNLEELKTIKSQLQEKIIKEL